jgi:hypothetical protein
MNIGSTLAIAIALFLIGCSSPTTRFSGAINDAKQSGRSVIVYEINPRTSPSGYYGPVGVYFINTAAKPLESVTFNLLTYRNYHAIRRAIKGFTAEGPFAPNHAYRFLTPEPAWPKLKGTDDCVTLVGMTIRRTDGKVIHVNENEIGPYLTANVATTCGQRRGNPPQ